MGKSKNKENDKKTMYKVRGFILNEDNKILMVKQNNRHNKIVWTFPGGKSKYNFKLYMKYICKKKIKQKTGLKVKIGDIGYTENTLYMFRATVVGGAIKVDKNNPKNKDVIDVQWLNIDDSRLQYGHTKTIIREMMRKK